MSEEIRLTVVIYIKHGAVSFRYERTAGFRILDSLDIKISL